MVPPADAAARENCIHMLSDMLAKIGRAAGRYSIDHSGESVQIGDNAEVNAAMSSTGHEYSVTHGFTDLATYDSQIQDLCLGFDCSDHVTSANSANFACGAPAHQKPTGHGGRGGRGGGGGRGRGRGGGKCGRGGGAPQQTFQAVTWSKGKLSCSAVGCKSVLNMNKLGKFWAVDKENRSKAANGGRGDPHFSPFAPSVGATARAWRLTSSVRRRARR